MKDLPPIVDLNNIQDTRTLMALKGMGASK